MADSLLVHGELSVFTLTKYGLPRSRRISPIDIARACAPVVAKRIEDQRCAWLYKVDTARSKMKALDYKIKALRTEKLGLLFTSNYIESKLRAHLSDHTYVWRDHILNGSFNPNRIVNAGEAFLVDAWQNIVELESMRFHGVGTGSTADAEADTNLQTASTTILNPDNVRATGSLGEASASVFRTVGTLQFDGSGTISEWGLFTSATVGAGTMWSHIAPLASPQAVVDTNALQFTYDLTVE